MKDFKILTIDTTNPEKTAILLAEGVSNDYRIIAKKIWRAKKNQSEELLPEIDKLLNKNKVAIDKLDLIIVCTGPGSFTGTRVGVAVANALAFGLGIPVIGVRGEDKKIEDVLDAGVKVFKRGRTGRIIMARPFYDKTPNITLPRNR